MRLVETPKLSRYTYACSAGDMPLSVAFHDRLTALVALVAEPTRDGEDARDGAARVYCPRCAHRMGSPSGALACWRCGLKLGKPDIFTLIELHYHRPDVTPEGST